VSSRRWGDLATKRYIRRDCFQSLRPYLTTVMGSLPSLSPQRTRSPAPPVRGFFFFSRCNAAYEPVETNATLPFCRQKKAAAYQTRWTVAGAIGVPTLHANASRNAGVFTRTPLTRYLPGECRSVLAASLAIASVRFTHQACA
jgi:hypothetical protein